MESNVYQIHRRGFDHVRRAWLPRAIAARRYRHLHLEKQRDENVFHRLLGQCRQQIADLRRIAPIPLQLSRVSRPNLNADHADAIRRPALVVHLPVDYQWNCLQSEGCYAAFAATSTLIRLPKVSPTHLSKLPGAHRSERVFGRLAQEVGFDAEIGRLLVREYNGR